MRAAILATAAVAAACAAAATHGAPSVGGSLRLKPLAGLDEFLPVPDYNPLTASKVLLGERLFFETRLSRDASLACASCHRPERAFADSASMSRGVRGARGRRNAPTLVNRAYGNAFSWDGHAATLEQQALEPIHDTLEMDLPIEALVPRLWLNAEYRRAFAQAFDDSITPRNVARALASFVRTIRSGDAPVDRYRNGDTSALTPAATRGMEVFSGKGNCSACHAGPNFTDERFHNTGVGARSGDRGRQAVTGNVVDRGAFKTPTLRNVEQTAPYMHDGSLATLDAVVEFYDSAGSGQARDPEIRPLRLTASEKHDLVAFLRALTGILTSGPFSR